MPSSYPATLDLIPLPDFDAALGQPARTAESLITDMRDSIKALQETLGTSTTPGQLLDVFLPRLDSTPVASALTIGTAVSATNIVTIGQDTNDTPAVNVTTSIQRTANTDDGFNLGRALRVKTLVNVDTAQNEWAVSGELDSYSDGTSSGHVAVSGISNKYGTAGVFGMHAQAKDFNVYAAVTDVTALVGAEINNPAIGLDHPTANQGAGNRVTLALIARTNPDVVGADTAEIGTGLHVITNGATGGNSGYYRYGVLVNEAPGNPDPIGTGMQVETTGPYGIRLQGVNTVAAIGLNSTQKIAFEGAGAITLSHAATPNRLMMMNAGSDRINFDLSATPMVNILGTKVLSVRQTGWAAATGTATRTSFATGSVTLPNLAQAVKALIDDLIAHGLIGA